jgi:dTDP-4-amino-4,6-dideoxygalactose transaminase
MIPLARPFLGEEETEAIREVVASGWVTQGPKVLAFEKSFCETFQAPFACAVSNGTAALFLALKVLGVGRGDAVITVSHSFIATSNAIRQTGAEALFVDIEKDSPNMSSEALKSFLEEGCERRDDGLYFKDMASLGREGAGRVKALLLVHQLGHPANLETFLEICRDYDLPLIEDAACAVGSEICFRGQWQKIGRPHGRMACFSFHPRKILTTGDGGMLCSTRREDDELLRLLRQHGMSLSDLDRHRSLQEESYLIEGFNFRLTDLQAAMGDVQLGRLPFFLKERRRHFEKYRQALGEDLDFYPVRPFSRPNHQSLSVGLPEKLSPDAFIKDLYAKGIRCKRGVHNAHEQKPYKNDYWRLPRSEWAFQRRVLLPLYNGLSEKQLKTVVASVKGIL